VAPIEIVYGRASGHRRNDHNRRIEAQADRLQLQIRDLVQLTEAIPAAADPDPHA